MNDLSESLIIEESSSESSPRHEPNIGVNRSPRKKSNPNIRKEYEELLEQSALLIEDGILCRDINHKMKSLVEIRAYRFYNSEITKWIRSITMFILMSLAFLESPNSLTLSPDPRKINSDPKYNRPELPHGLTESIELIILFIIGAMALLETWLVGIKSLKRKPWILFLLFSCLFSMIDLIVDLTRDPETNMLRLRRLLRPFIFIQSSSMMKKLLKSVIRTIPEMLSVLLLLAFHLYFFTMIGMLVLKEQENPSDESTVPRPPFPEDGDAIYFARLGDAIISLLVLLTTANNPDVMMPAYKLNRFASIFFIVFSAVGTFLIMNLLTAVIYNQFRGFLRKTLQNSLDRRLIAFYGAFHKLLESDKVKAEESSENFEFSCIKSETILSCLKLHPKNFENFGNTERDRMILDKSDVSLSDFNQLMDSLCYTTREKLLIPSETKYPRLIPLQNIILHPNFDHVGNLIAVINVITLSFEITFYPEHLNPHKNALDEVFTTLRYINLAIAVYYILEQIAKLWAYGIVYCQKIEFLYDGLVSSALITIQIIEQTFITSADNSADTEWVWILSRIINILIMLRLLRILPRVPALALVMGSLFETLKNLKHCAGILFAAFYLYASFGMILFQGELNYERIQNSTSEGHNCGSYGQLGYYSNNFDDFFSAIVLLWDLLVVNNWHVFLHVFRDEINPWAQLYFITWWLTAAVIILNIFVALILDNFIAKWETSASVTNEQGVQRTIFKNSMLEMYKGWVLFQDVVSQKF